MFYRSGAPVDIQKIVEVVYRERLSEVSKLSWMPVQGRLTDFRPTPFIKSFLTYLIDRLVEDGYIIQGWSIAAYERARASDIALETSKARIYSIWLGRKIVEVADKVEAKEAAIEAQPPQVKITRLPKSVRLEIKDITYVSDVSRPPEVAAEPPATKAVYLKQVLKVPSLDYLKKLCTWGET